MKRKIRFILAWVFGIIYIPIITIFLLCFSVFMAIFGGVYYIWAFIANNEREMSEAIDNIVFIFKELIPRFLKSSIKSLKY